MDWGFKAWRSRPLFRKGTVVETAQVQGGWSRSVPLVAPRDLAATIPLTAADGVKAQVVYDGPIQAPITKGQEIARLVVTDADGAPQSMPLVAGEDVSQAGFFGRLWNGFLSFFG
jgi:D-alanyl-D-alanine carboxypeptidase (penicillin-binding protein 5/6)